MKIINASVNNMSTTTSNNNKKCEPSITTIVRSSWAQRVSLSPGLCVAASMSDMGVECESARVKAVIISKLFH